MTTVAQCEQRLRESLRMRLAALDMFPDEILPGRWERSERFLELFGELDAKAAYLFGLSHETGHHDQFAEAKRQALRKIGTLTVRALSSEIDIKSALCPPLIEG